MQDRTYDLEREIIEEENDYETGDSNHRPFTTDQGLNGKRPKVKSNNFYGFPSAGTLPIVYPHSRPYSEKSGKPSGRLVAQNTSFKSHDRSSHINAKDLELEQTSRNLQSPKKYLAAPSSGLQKNYKIIPKNIPQDKERLYDEALNLKHLVHSLKDENLRLKTRVNLLEKESVKFERMMADQDGGMLERELVPKPSEGHLVVGLKNKLIEVENSLHEKEAELTKIKKSVRVTKIAELEVQLKTFTEESYRLKGILEQLLKEKTVNTGKQESKNKLQEECILQAAQIKALEKDHEQLVKIIKAFEQQCADYEKKLTEADKKKKSETQKLKKLVAEKEKENLKLQQELETAYSHLPSGQTSGKKTFGATREEIALHELERKKAENLNLLEQLNDRNIYIQQIEKKLKDATKLSVPTMEKSSSMRRPSNRQQLSLNIPTDVAAQPVVKIQAQVQFEKDQKNESALNPEGENNEDDFSEGEATQVEQEEESERVVSVPRKRVQKVSADDVKELGYEINLALRAKGISFDEVNKSVWPEPAEQQDRISIKEVIQVLKREPFCIKNEDDAILIARYLIEENQAEYLYYNEDTEGDLVIAKSILRKLIGPIPNWSKETLQSLNDSVSELCTKHHLSLRENLRVSCKDGNLNRKALKEVCKLIEVPVTDEQIEFIITKLFEKSHNIQALSIESLFETFFRPPKETDLLVNSSAQHRENIQTRPVIQEKVNVVQERKSKNEFVLPEPKHEVFVSESPLKNRPTPSQGSASQNEVKENKSKLSVESKVVNEVRPSSREQKSSVKDESRNYEDESEQHQEEGNQNQGEQREDEYQFEEENEEEKEEEKEQLKVENKQQQGIERNLHPPQIESDRHEGEQSPRANSIEVPESRRLESLPTNHTNTTQFSDPKSDVFGVPSRNQHEERKEDPNEHLNPISEKDENIESRREPAGEKKVAKEQEDEEENEYREEVGEALEEDGGRRGSESWKEC